MIREFSTFRWSQGGFPGVEVFVGLYQRVDSAAIPPPLEAFLPVSFPGYERQSISRGLSWQLQQDGHQLGQCGPFQWSWQGFSGDGSIATGYYLIVRFLDGFEQLLGYSAFPSPIPLLDADAFTSFSLGLLAIDFLVPT